MVSVSLPAYTPHITDAPTNEGTSGGTGSARSSDSETTPSAAQSGTTENSDFLASYARDSAPAFHPPEGSTSTHSRDRAVGESSQDAAFESNFSNWLDSGKRGSFEKKSPQKQEEIKQAYKQSYQKASEMRESVASQINSLPTDSRSEAQSNLEFADQAIQQGEFGVAKDYLDSAKQSVEQNKPSQAGPSSAEGRKWPEKPNSEYPHGAKHRPGFKTTDVTDSYINAKIKNESSNGKPAKYNTSVAAEANRYEKDAYENGLLMSHDGDFTTVHKASTIIGASEGQLTQYIRIDGTDHGHPITQEEFDSRIKNEVEHLKKNHQDTTQISNYLNKIGEDPKRFELTS